MHLDQKTAWSAMGGSTLVVISLTPEDLAGIIDSKHRQSDVSMTPAALLEKTIGGGIGTEGRDRG